MNEHYEFVNVPLPFDFDALEPFIDAETMELHHNAHLQGYINKLNSLLRNRTELHDWPLERLFRERDAVGEDISNMAGGVYNHFFFFEQLGKGSPAPEGRLLEMINDSFGSFEEFLGELSEKAMRVFGSGYAWLVLDDEGLKIVATENQNLPDEDVVPILNIDVWEHAYYLKHHNLRQNYINDFFNVINYKVASARLEDAIRDRELIF